MPGDIGHPVQWDNSQSNWYVIGAASTTSNSIYHGIVGYSTDIQAKNSAVNAQRKSENRDLDDRIYKLRYVVPKEYEEITYEEFIAATNDSNEYYIY